MPIEMFFNIEHFRRLLSRIKKNEFEQNRIDSRIHRTRRIYTELGEF